MSLYGNVKKIGSATFQFDRKYSNRTTMDNSASTDGVYAGRYVLVEYGYRFGIDDQNVTTTEEGTAISEFPEGYKLINTEDGSVRVEGVTENQAFKANAELDLRTYGAVYDSTVWQKIYVNGKDKYIMVAELNAMAPKLDITQETPLTYKALESNIDQYRTAGVLTGKFNENGELIETVRLTNAKEIYNKPYFDTGIDTELTYLMHLPTSLNLEMDSGTIDFHEEGFNLVYSYPDSEGVSTIAWIPKGHDNEGKVTYLDNYKINDDNLTDNGGNPFATLQGSEYPMDTKMLFMSFPALGNAMNALYNLLYGKPDPEDDLTHGAMRPYFKRFLENLKMRNRAYVYDYTTDPNHPTLVYVTYGDPENPDYIYTEGIVGEKVVATLNENDALMIDGLESPNWLEPHELVEIRFRDDVDVDHLNETFPYLGYYQLDSDDYDNSMQNNHAGAYVLWDVRNSCPITTEIHIPNGDEDPDLEWLKDIPALADILANNTAGLATILSSLFGSVDPLTGTTRYYLYNDWRTKVDEGSSTPAIANKPKIVGGYEQTFTSVIAGAEQFDAIGRKIYETPGYFYDIGIDANTSGQQILYPHTEITTSNYYSGGDFVVDYNTWQLINYYTPTINIKINSITNVTGSEAQNNQEAITIIQQDNTTFNITSNIGLQSYELDGVEGKWLLLDIDTGFEFIDGIQLDGTALDDLDEVEADSFDLPKGHFVLKIDAEDMPTTYTLSASGFNDLIFTITYKFLQA